MTEHGSLNELRAEARSIYGADVASYAAGRPDYPDEVYAALSQKCGLKAGAIVLEIGPGTGLVTQHLLDHGATVVAVEPDAQMADYLAGRFADIEVIGTAFEQAELEENRFDLVVAVTSFHWVNQMVGVPKIARLLKPGGSVALWWTVFDDPERPDQFREKLRTRTGEEDPGGQRHVEFQMDLEGRMQDLSLLGGLEDAGAQKLHWTAEMDSHELRSLYASLLDVARRDPKDKRRFLDQVVDAADAIGPEVSRPFVTVLYTAVKPG
jgi:SAM-dependent methyltransferase